MDRFPACLAETLKWEGGWSNDPYDPGGATMHGVIQVEYDAFRDRKSLPRRSVRQIELAEEQEIYRGNYWVPARCGEMPAGVDLVVNDFSINSGCGQAIKSLQRVLGLSIDGHMGSLTMAAVHAAAPAQLIRSYMDERRRFLRSLKTFWRFGTGWMRRCDGVEAAALAAVHGGPALFYAEAGLATPLVDPDAQSASQGRAPAAVPAPPMATEATLSVGGLGGLTAAMPKIMAQSTVGGKFSIQALAVAVLSSEIFWLAAVCAFGAVCTYIYRRRHNA